MNKYYIIYDIYNKDNIKDHQRRWEILTTKYDLDNAEDLIEFIKEYTKDNSIFILMNWKKLT